MGGHASTNVEGAVSLDVTDPIAVAKTARWIVRDHGHLDVLVNNAGISGPPRTRGPRRRLTLTTYAKCSTPTSFGVITVTNMMLPLLHRAAAGRIVNLSSGLGSMTWQKDSKHYISRLPAHLAYPCSKTALNALTVQYAKELRDTPILVNATAPGACATDFTASLGFDLTRAAAQGAAIAVRLAVLGPEGGSGGCFDDDGVVDWWHAHHAKWGPARQCRAPAMWRRQA